MERTWRCNSCLVVNAEEATECACCMERRSKDDGKTNENVMKNANENDCNNLTDSEKKIKKKNDDNSSINTDTNVEAHATNSTEDTKHSENTNEGKSSMFDGDGFMPSFKQSPDMQSSNKSIFITAALNSNATTATNGTTTATHEDTNGHIKENKTGENNTTREKTKKSIGKGKQKKMADKRERAPSTRIQPIRKCTQKKINYRT
ncbi:conserved Plasmodium protein, unknown function [Plasmodium knowlesi strain H]|uniref:RanBP2-type domain-containing protein n=3 Tax=Plasmodium knowlesi TaxID=5850 RepID=A0A5K1U465_PLAKH|nr:zinc finger protein, putative [Plasmodium knowlesi strain H]OTN64132.1 Uncharacterized protein PKNOH_S140235900 [Plasmodium knowlesi]CAA9990781.1 zinc finger protein, putative [Plasmodium knowlesi strain H]SBO21088.1 conserved Plasmodium protein, unknown function [Plasmodium knowlesi strain H]SBO21567.1 conserved Plasmodium protein, unknown function [Plasmodium knowlesi strain H]VVS80255.1 zinc finger protein, putative [Plasmodium knowlesi strain H]|eukprot:XP_002262070.1 hypothetical protein, conserved in Plasmodium species [Plasmodium knowlesi strain H]